jgi:mannose-6-phosphate isomerase-like protein (cupin superfamily)
MFISPEVHTKTWGSELWIANNDQYCGKILSLRCGAACSLHFHIKKHETFHILAGLVKMEIIHKDGTRNEISLQPSDTIEITPGLVHRFTGLTDAKILEVSTHHDEEDSYRIEVSTK